MKVGCPKCEGHGFRNNRTCSMCNGTGHVHTEHICRCGRPAVVQTGDELTCTTAKCQEAVLSGKKPEVSTRNVDYYQGENYEFVN